MWRKQRLCRDCVDVMRGSRFFVSGGLNLTTFFCLVYEGKNNPYAKSRVLLKVDLYRPVSWPNIGCWPGGLVLFFKKTRPIILRQPIALLFPGGWESDIPNPPSGYAHACARILSELRSPMRLKLDSHVLALL